MLISNVFNDDNFELIIDGTILKFFETHKHLGVNLSLNNKWSKNINSITESASKQISILRKNKYELSKQTGHTLYCTYILPLLKYTSEVWDRRTQADTNNLEQVQLNAAQIVTGLSVLTT